MTSKLHRSMLYMPGSNARAMEKARVLMADTIIFDLEDAVAPSSKGTARTMIVEAFNKAPYSEHEVLVRINSLQTPWGGEDIKAMVLLPCHGLVLPKIDTVYELHQTLDAIDAAGGAHLPVWIMTETALGVLHADEVYGCSDRVAGVILGTSDLAAELRIPHTADRIGFLHLLSHCVIAARAHGLEIIDGVHLNFQDMDEFKQHCVQGLQLGFDGKSLIHPKQIEPCNQVFSPTPAQIEHAAEIVKAWLLAQEAGEGVCVVNGKLIENLHITEAERILAFANAIRKNLTENYCGLLG